MTGYNSKDRPRRADSSLGQFGKVLCPMNCRKLSQVDEWSLFAM
jgi:hypothetical protein